MRSQVAAVALVLALLSASGCSDDGPTLHDLANATGCAYVRPVSDVEKSVRIFRITVRDCDQKVADRNDAERIAAAAWRYLRRPVDRVDVRSFPAATEPTTVSFHGEDLAGLDQVNSLSRSPGQPRDGNDSPLWLLLPISYVAVAVVMLIAVRRLRRAGILFVVFRG